jgi:hypothetical protein
MLMIAYFVKHPERGWSFNRGISVRLRPYRTREDLAWFAQPHDRGSTTRLRRPKPDWFSSRRRAAASASGL